MRVNLIGAFIRNFPFGTEIAFKKGFDRLGGHTITTIDPSYVDQRWDYGADVTVVFKWMDAYWEDLKKCEGKKIVYQPDDMRYPHIRQMMQKMRKHCDYAFTFDDDGAKLALEYGYRAAKKLLLTADDELYAPLPMCPKTIPVCFVGSVTGGENHKSRRKMIELVAKSGIQIGVAHELFDVHRIRQIYASSKIVLNHATDVGQPFGHGFGYQCRHFEAGMVGSCILSNVVDNDTTIKSFETFSNEEELVDKVRYLLEPDQAVHRREIADQLFWDIVDHHRPEHRAAEMVKLFGEFA